MRELPLPIIGQVEKRKHPASVGQFAPPDAALATVDVLKRRGLRRIVLVDLDKVVVSDEREREVVDMLYVAGEEQRRRDYRPPRKVARDLWRRESSFSWKRQAP